MTNKFTFLVVAAGLLFFSTVVIGVCVLLPNNATLYALFAGILGNFSGALFTLLHVTANSTTTTVAGNPPKIETVTEQK